MQGYRARRKNFRLYQKASTRSERGSVGGGDALLGGASPDEGAHFDREVRLDAERLPPLVTWGNSPEAWWRSQAPCLIQQRSRTKASAQQL